MFPHATPDPFRNSLLGALFGLCAKAGEEQRMDARRTSSDNHRSRLLENGFVSRPV
jgi:hypothetical protein